MHQPKGLFQSAAQALSFQPIIISAWRTHATHARSLINLTQVRAGEMLLDRFAGTCGILIESYLIGIQERGKEVQTRPVKGPLCNLLCLDCSLLLGEAKRLPLQNPSIDAAVLDTPNSRSA